MKYDILIQNNGTKQKFFFQSLTAYTVNNLYVEFVDFEMPDDVPFGEYLYYLIPYEDNLVPQYKEKDVLKDTIVILGDIEYKINDINHSSGLLKYHDSESPAIERDTNKQVVYRRKKG